MTVTDHSAATLVPIIKRWLLPGTTVLSDCWRAYSSLVNEGFVHETVNHSIEFVSECGTHTNTIEGTWSALKKSLPHYGTTKDLYNSYFAEYCIRKKFFGDAGNKFIEFLRLVCRVYKQSEPPVGPQPDGQQTELLAQAPPTGGSACESTVYTFSQHNIGNFDLWFDVDEDVDEHDMSANLFL